ncbi:hypothetical protein V8G54_019786 [Vigna mungo]|uniref:Transposase n=1 Tax=Vigna mungo TaxID=3915 RepID=A0AAQ3NB60_VIGMU
MALVIRVLYSDFICLGTLPSTNAVVTTPLIEEQSPSKNPTISESIEVQPTNETSSHDSLNSTPSMPTENTEQPTTSKKHVGRESSSYWNVDAIDLEGVIKKIKVKVREVSNLPNGQHIIVDFDEVGMAIGEGQGVLARYCGILATDDNLFSINFERWSGKTGMPNTYFLECFKDILQTTEAIAQRYCKLTLGKKWVAHRQSLWNEFYDPTKTKDQIICNVPTGIDRTQWAHFVTYRLKPETMEICKKNRENRKKQVIPHTGGSKPISRRRHEMLFDSGQLPSRGMLYIETHKRKDGSFVNEVAKAIASVRPKHSRRVRCMGLGATPTNSFRNTRMRLSNLSIGSSSTTTSSTSTNQWEQKYMNLEGALKAYMIMKEGKIPDELATFFDPQPQLALLIVAVRFTCIVGSSSSSPFPSFVHDTHQRPKVSLPNEATKGRTASHANTTPPPFKRPSIAALQDAATASIAATDPAGHHAKLSLLFLAQGLLSFPYLKSRCYLLLGPPATMPITARAPPRVAAATGPTKFGPTPRLSP